MNFRDAKERMNNLRWGNSPSNWLIREISTSNEMSESEKVEVLEISGGYISVGSNGMAYTNLRESLYNILDMLNRDSEVVATERKLADYSNLIEQRIVYIDTKRVIGIVNDSELGNVEITKSLRYMKLTPIGRKYAKALAMRGTELATQQFARLKRLGL